MSSAVMQLLVLAGVAVFLILRLRNVLGTREGFEKPPVAMPGQNDSSTKPRPDFEVIEGGPDRDITDHVEEDSAAAEALAAMKATDPDFAVGPFLEGARGAYEMILMAYEQGDLSGVRDFLDADIYEAFAAGIEARRDQGISIEAEFIGLREVTLDEATFDTVKSEAEITMRFVGELSSTVRDKGGDVIAEESSPLKKTKDNWTFARTMGGDDPNWPLVATGG